MTVAHGYLGKCTDNLAILGPSAPMHTFSNLLSIKTLVTLGKATSSTLTFLHYKQQKGGNGTMNVDSTSLVNATLEVWYESSVHSPGIFLSQEVVPKVV